MFSRLAFTLITLVSIFPWSITSLPAILPSTSLVNELTTARKIPFSWTCSFPIVKDVCQAFLTNSVQAVGDRILLKTSNGPIIGLSGSLSTRYTIPFAQPPVGNLRFANPLPFGRFSSPYDGTNFPPPCPQTVAPGQNYTNEDCLYINVYTPNRASTSNPVLPVFVWIHGGSLLVGSSTGPGLDGSTLAATQKMVVITVQYRLGLLGFMRADSASVSGNMGVQDLLLALQFIRNNVAAFGGDPKQITLAGQSSGADLVKTLLNVPAASDLFARAILHSPSINFDDQSGATASLLGQAALTGLGCQDIACLRTKSVDGILSAQNNVAQQAPSLSPAVDPSVPIRPFVDGSLIRSTLLSLTQSRVPMATGGKPIIVTTVREEGAPTVANISPVPLPSFAFDPIVAQTLTDRSQAVLSSGIYTPVATDPDGVRNALTTLVTDYVWRCAAQQTAANLTALGSKFWLAEFEMGIQYPPNAQLPYCTNKVCHQDDIYYVFGTGSNLDSTQQALTKEVMARWAAFSRSGNPNVQPYITWDPVVSSTALNLLRYDALSSIDQAERPLACGPNALWGNRVLFDEQLYPAV